MERLTFSLRGKPASPPLAVPAKRICNEDPALVEVRCGRQTTPWASDTKSKLARNEIFDLTFSESHAEATLASDHLLRLWMQSSLRNPDNSVRVGIAGVGNCASSFVQGITYYTDALENEPAAGLMHAELGGYRPSDIAISAAFDISAAKVGRDVGEAIFAQPNNTARFAKVAKTGVVVQRGPTLDGLGKYLRDEIDESDAPEADVTQVLRDTRTDVLVSYLPVGSQCATEFYAERALEAGCAFVNCIPVFIASNDKWRSRFAERGLPLVGDDIKSQVGATIVHRVLTNLFRERVIRIDRTYQLNFGANSVSLNMLERERLQSKKIS